VKSITLGTLGVLAALLAIPSCRKAGTPSSAGSGASSETTLSPVTSPGNGGEFKTEDEKTAYALGLYLSRSLVPLNLSEAELKLVVAGLSDGSTGKTPKVPIEVYGPKLNDFTKVRLEAAAAAEKKASIPFLEKAAAEKGAAKKPSGLIVREIKAGTGPSPKPGDKVKVNYEGSLRDGTIFDSSVKRGQPVVFQVGQVIPCWSEGLQTMKVGGKSRFVCPSPLAYGDSGSPPKIRPGAALSFDVELLEIEK
jgi:FKBP-type peptidyl-prolyl cis-trans isomerase FkpA/FKBP-type peptidyl-prolyl cis-trans isomerase FklB